MSTSNSQLDMKVLNVHTPTSSYAIVHSLQEETFQTLIAKLARKEGSSKGLVGEGWIKYEWNESVWDLNDESDYSIFVWRFANHDSPTLHLRDPSTPCPTPITSTTQYANPSYYSLRPPSAHMNGSAKANSGTKPSKSTKSKRKAQSVDGHGAGGMNGNVPVHKKEFERFHSENGNRTVIGQIGPVKGVRMLLKAGYRHVYVSRIFASKHGFIPRDATPGNYGYGGIVHIGTFPITLPPNDTTTHHSLYLTEEPHFDVVLGRSFIEKRGVVFDSLDQTMVVCHDTGERLEVEVVVLRDGRGEVVTVT